MDPISFIIMLVAYLFSNESKDDKPAQKKQDENGNDDDDELDDRPFFKTVVLRDRSDD